MPMESGRKRPSAAFLVPLLAGLFEQVIFVLSENYSYFYIRHFISYKDTKFESAHMNLWLTVKCLL